MLGIRLHQSKLLFGAFADARRKSVILRPKIGGGEVLHYALERSGVALLLIV